jgi:uncharacterized protein (DUF2249 family)
MNGRGQKSATFDVRRLAAAEQFLAVLSMFDALEAGCAFTVICDFDPARLRRLFVTHFGSDYSWACLRQGPPVWEIGIGRTGVA